MIPKQYFNSNKKFKSHKFRKWFLRSGHISLPDSDLGDCEGKVGGCWCNERVSQYIWRGREVSPFRNIYVMAGSVVQCSHDTGGEIQGLESWRVIIVTLLTIPAHHYTELTVLLWELHHWQLVQLEN